MLDVDEDPLGLITLIGVLLQEVEVRCLACALDRKCPVVPESMLIRSGVSLVLEFLWVRGR